MLSRSTDCLRRRGASMENLAHSASLHSGEKSAPSNPGIKQLEGGSAVRRRSPPPCPSPKEGEGFYRVVSCDSIKPRTPRTPLPTGERGRGEGRTTIYEGETTAQPS